MPTLQKDLQSAILSITFHRPERANAFNFEMLSEFQSTLVQAAKDSQVRGVILTGAGKVFCAGHDVREMLASQGQKTSYKKHLQETYNPLILQIRQMEKPVIAAVNGPVAGAGLGVALACDMRFATETASFTVGFSGIGLVPDSGVSLFLPVLIGLSRATEFTFTNQPISSKQALEWGLVNRIVSERELQFETTNFMSYLVKGPVGAFGLTKRLFNQAILPNLAEVLMRESEVQEIASKGDEHANGVKLFLK
jgi:2-(1,2-epoxy-1,2-dihydrophenyl)acetyl-CoA isomerase